MSEQRSQLWHAVRDASQRELARVRFPASDAQLDAIADSVEAGTPNEDAQSVLTLAQLGNARRQYEAPGPDDQILLMGHPVSALEVYNLQREGWEGFGWTGEKRRRHLDGRKPNARELSPGGRQAMEWDRNHMLLERAMAPRDTGVARAHEAIQPESWLTNPLTAIPALMLDAAYTSPEEATEQYAKDADIGQREYGDSGYMGAIFNPEYGLGYAMNRMNVLPEATWWGIRDALMSPPDAGPSGAAHYATLEPESQALEAGRQARSFLGGLVDTIGAADDMAWFAGQTQAVEPTIPDAWAPEGATWQDLDRARARMNEVASSSGPNFDTWYKQTYGEYPSYAGSTAAMLINGLADPSLAAGNIGSKATLGLAKGLASLSQAAGRSAPKLMRPAANLLGRYGGHIANKTAAGMGGYASRVAEEVGEEGVTGAALGGGASFIQQIPMPSLRTWLTPGDKARTDLYVPGEDGKMRPETPQEFEQKVRASQDAYASGPRTANWLLQQQELQDIREAQAQKPPLTDQQRRQQFDQITSDTWLGPGWLGNTLGTTPPSLPPELKRRQEALNRR